MKTLTGEKITLSADGKSITMTADIVDQQFNKLLITRVTHTHINPDNEKHGRGVQMSNEAVFIHSRYGSMAFPNDIFAKIAAAVEPLTSFPPVIQKGSLASIKVISELPVTFQWQISDNAFPKGTFPVPEAKWEDIAGATSDTLDDSAIADGKWIRCVVKNGAGLSVTQAAQKLTKK